MAAHDLSPCNTDPLQASKFILAFPRITATQFFCQAANIPGITTNPTVQNTSLVDLAVPGDKLQYENFNIEFIVDEELKSWSVIFDWMKGIAFPQSNDQYKNLGPMSRYSSTQKFPQYADAELTVLSAANNAKVKVHFIDAFPISLSEIKLDIRQDASHIVTAFASFKFKNYDLINL